MSFTFDGIFEDATEENIVRWRIDEARKIRHQVIAELGNVNGQLDIIINALTKYSEAVKSHLLNEGYIHEPSPIKTGWLLTEKGNLVKELGGHRKYKRYRQTEIKALRNQQLTNAGLITATILAAIMPFVAETCNKPKATQVILPRSYYNQNQELLQSVPHLEKILSDSSEYKVSIQHVTQLSKLKQTK